MILTRLASGPSVIRLPLASSALMTRGVSNGKLASIDGLKAARDSAVISRVSTAAAEENRNSSNDTDDVF